MAGTILLGVDVESNGPPSETYARLGPRMLEALGISATWYVTGQTLERYPKAFVEAEKCGCVELQAHTYSHMLLKSICVEIPPGRSYAGAEGWLCRRGGSNEQVEADLARCQQVFRDVLGRAADALTGPWGYYRGLMDRPDLLDIVRALGFRILRTFARDERDAEPVPLDWQPFFYEPQGFGDVLELCVHGYQDEGNFAWLTGGTITDDWLACLRALADRAAAEDLVWSLASHDHRCHTPEGFAAKTEWIEQIVRYAQPLGIRFLTASLFYQERLARKA